MIQTNHLPQSKSRLLALSERTPAGMAYGPSTRSARSGHFASSRPSAARVEVVEGERFELSRAARTLPVFKTGPFNRSGTPPEVDRNSTIEPPESATRSTIDFGVIERTP